MTSQCGNDKDEDGASYLVPLECVLPCERLPAPAIAEERLLTRVRVPVSLEVVLAVERQRAQVARERSRGRSGILGRADRTLAVRSLRTVLCGCHVGHCRRRLRR